MIIREIYFSAALRNNSQQLLTITMLLITYWLENFSKISRRFEFIKTLLTFWVCANTEFQPTDKLFASEIDSTTALYLNWSSSLINAKYWITAAFVKMYWKWVSFPSLRFLFSEHSSFHLRVIRQSNDGTVHRPRNISEKYTSTFIWLAFLWTMNCLGSSFTGSQVSESQKPKQC